MVVEKDGNCDEEIDATSCSAFPRNGKTYFRSSVELFRHSSQEKSSLFIFLHSRSCIGGEPAQRLELSLLLNPYPQDLMHFQSCI